MKISIFNTFTTWWRHNRQLAGEYVNGFSAPIVLYSYSTLCKINFSKVFSWSVLNGIFLRTAFRKTTNNGRYFQIFCPGLSEKTVFCVFLLIPKRYSNFDHIETKFRPFFKFSDNAGHNILVFGRFWSKINTTSFSKSQKMKNSITAVYCAVYCEVYLKT